MYLYSHCITCMFINYHCINYYCINILSVIYLLCYLKFIISRWPVCSVRIVINVSIKIRKRLYSAITLPGFNFYFSIYVTGVTSAFGRLFLLMCTILLQNKLKFSSVKSFCDSKYLFSHCVTWSFDSGLNI